MPQMQVIRRGLDPKRAALAAGIQSGTEAIANAGQNAAMLQYQQQQNKEQSDKNDMMNFGRLLNSAETQEQADNIMVLGRRMGLDTSGFSWLPPQQKPNDIDIARYEYAQDQLDSIDASIMAAGEGWNGSPVSGQGWGSPDGSFNQQMHNDVKLQNRSWTHNLPWDDGYNADELANFEKIKPLYAERVKYQQVLDDFNNRFSSSSPSVRASSEISGAAIGSAPAAQTAQANTQTTQAPVSRESIIQALGRDPGFNPEQWQALLQKAQSSNMSIQDIVNSINNTQ